MLVWQGRATWLSNNIEALIITNNRINTMNGSTASYCEIKTINGIGPVLDTSSVEYPFQQKQELFGLT